MMSAAAVAVAGCSLVFPADTTSENYISVIAVTIYIKSVVLGVVPIGLLENLC